ncbi:LysR family transcriptional regulator [Aestuariibacter halophilus]|uniref:LysR family transcriptional regulator n=1 Tax=Fluctibacter halophilus TaxID=226011 RepID=A0ABS8G7C8_9ALTE|nr:LysR family transcriptional regulator [Aestuariibacter halophilus]MCC2616384.1 LysR family transcriptional regulator [Aestuariibacter halophilus]
MRPQELNLLMVFDAIMTERSITRAADRLAMTQPAVSNAVSRMRTAWKDDLFVKDGRNIKPTVYAQNLWSQVREPLMSLTDAIDPQQFDPGSARRTFRIAVADVVVDMAWSSMRQLIERDAPGINLYAIPYTIAGGDQMLEEAEVDLVIGASSVLSPSFRNDYLLTPIYVCAMRPEHMLAKENLSLEEFVAADHLLVSLSGDTTGYTDQALLEYGLKRRIACTVNHFSAVPKLLLNSNLISVVPISGISQALVSGELAATKPPVDITGQQIGMVWHKRQDNDAGLLWLRQHLKRIITHEMQTLTAQVLNRLCKNKGPDCANAANAMSSITQGIKKSTRVE